MTLGGKGYSDALTGRFKPFMSSNIKGYTSDNAGKGSSNPVKINSATELNFTGVDITDSRVVHLSAEL
jgi:hypothetical protein